MKMPSNIFIFWDIVNLKRIILFLLIITGIDYSQSLLPVVPPELRGRIDAERSGIHDANRIRTLFYNFGMVGDYPADPINVDLTIFHSVEVPKGSGENYSDGTTPFVLAKITQSNNAVGYIMETGYRERQGTSGITNKIMRFEPRPGYFQDDPNINAGRSVAISNDQRTWPDQWADKLLDFDDPGWSGSWNGYFGKAPRADQESYIVYDDNFYDAWNYFPDSRDNTRRGLGLKVEQRGFQWANPQAGNVIFFHYDIANESTTDYNDNIIFGLYMDSGVGGSAIGVDGVAESDDDNAFFDKEAGLNLVYTWDKNGNGTRGTTGYLGYSYLETPGNSLDVYDNDNDGMLNEKRDGGEGIQITGRDEIKNYVIANYNIVEFENFYGPLDRRPAYIAGVWWTGDEDLDWVAEYNDTGADGVLGTNDTGEKDNIPTNGETNFDRTDIDESDQIGLTGFKMNRIRAGQGAPSTVVDNIVFFDDGKEWPKRLYNIFTDPDSSFDQPLVLNYNIGFLFASGPFKLPAGKTERFSLALGFGKDLRELRNTTKIVLQIYKANYQFAVPPPTPTLNAFAGDQFVTLAWDNAAERAYDPITNENDFEGYRIYRSTDPAFLDPQVIFTGTGTGPIGNGKPLAQFDLINDIYGFSNVTVEGVAYYLGDDTGLRHNYKDTTVVNGQTYYYSVTAYDRGVDSVEIYPSENSMSVTRTLRGGTILPKNVFEVIPNPPVPGYENADITGLIHSSGSGYGSVSLQILNPEIVPDDNSFELFFIANSDSVRAESYGMVNRTTGDTLFQFGYDFAGEGTGPSGTGILPVISTPKEVQIDTLTSGFSLGSPANIKYKSRYAAGFPIGLRRPGYPYNIEIRFSDTVQDTSIAAVGLPKKAAKFKIVAKTPTAEIQMDFRYRNQFNDSTLASHGDYIEILTRTNESSTQLRATWYLEVDTSGAAGNIISPEPGDIYHLNLLVPYSETDKFTFSSLGQALNADKARSDYENKPYVVPNPYVGAASFEPQRFAVSGRGERKMEFRNLPANSTVRIYTINGELVNTLFHDGDIAKGVVTWDLRNTDRLEVAPGLYIFHVEGIGLEDYIGKFAIIK